VRPQKTLSPIVVTLSGITINLRQEHPQKALLAMVVTVGIRRFLTRKTPPTDDVLHKRYVLLKTKKRLATTSKVRKRLMATSKVKKRLTTKQFNIWRIGCEANQYI
jgi:hypothetical protein